MLKLLRIYLFISLITLTFVSVGALAAWEFKGAHFYSVQTASMEPIIKPGDLAITLKTQPSGLRAGDIVSYRSSQNPDLIITHRVYRQDPSRGYLVTKGDNLKISDQPIAYNAITGKVYKVVPDAGRLLNIVHNPIGLIAVVYLPAFIAAAYEMSRITQFYSRSAYGLKT